MTRRRKNIKQNANSDPNDTQGNKPEAKYTPLQLEQTKLAKQLESYIIEFETKINQLNYKLLNRELVILFVANLHPRWKRLVEPVEHTFQQWEEAANAARYHCVKLSALLGGERVDTSPLFITQESLDILQSGYFASETNSDVERYSRESPIQHLISPTFTTAHVAKNIASVSLPPSAATMNIEKKEKTKDKSHEKEKRKEKRSEKAKEKENIIEKEKTEKKVETKEEMESEKVEKDVKKEIQKAKKRKAPTETNEDEKQKQETKDVLKQQNNSFSKVQNNNNKNNDTVIAESDIYYTVPECYKNVNLMFLSLNTVSKD